MLRPPPALSDWGVGRMNIVLAVFNKNRHLEPVFIGSLSKHWLRENRQSRKWESTGACHTLPTWMPASAGMTVAQSRSGLWG